MEQWTDTDLVFRPHGLAVTVQAGPDRHGGVLRLEGAAADGEVLPGLLHGLIGPK